MSAIDFELEEPGRRRCTIADRAEGEAKLSDYRHQKYAHVKVVLEPASGPASFIFGWEAFDVFPFPWAKDASLAGVKAALSEPLPGGDRIVLVRVSVVGGSFHDTDTDEESVRTAARLAVRRALSNATFVRL